MEATHKRFDSIDILFNNAGITWRGGILDTSPDEWDRVLRTNLTSVFLGCKSVIPAMLSRCGGAIVNHASINALQGNTNLVAYCASKGGVTAITRALAIGTGASTISAGTASAPRRSTRSMTRGYLETVDDPKTVTASIIDKHPIGRMATAEEVASVAVFLASSEASYMTGTTIPADGGALDPLGSIAKDTTMSKIQ